MKLGRENTLLGSYLVTMEMLLYVFVLMSFPLYVSCQIQSLTLPGSQGASRTVCTRCGSPPGAQSQTPSMPARALRWQSWQSGPMPSFSGQLATNVEPPSLEFLHRLPGPHQWQGLGKIQGVLLSEGIVLRVPGYFLGVTIDDNIHMNIKLPQYGSSGSHFPLSWQVRLVAPTTSWPGSGQLKDSLSLSAPGK